MSKKVVIIGAGFAGHTAALYLGNALGKNNNITVINRQEQFVYIPSLVWAGIDRMDLGKLQFPLKPVYNKFNINFFHGRASDIFIDEQYVIAIDETDGNKHRFDYDYLINATGPYLNFEATPGLGPHVGLTQSICSPPHAEQAKNQYLKAIDKMKTGEKQTFVIGTGHGTATCQGAAFEYITNIHKDLIRRKLRDKAKIKWISNEAAAGDFGIDGVTVLHGKKLSTSEEFIKMIYDEYDIDYQVQTAVKQIDGNVIHWENYEAEAGSTKFDFAMLIPAFKANKLNYWDKGKNDISEKLTNPGGFLLVDGVYGKPYKELRENPEYWPATYQSPHYSNVYAAGIAFAPPGPISKPFTNKNGTAISAAAPRTGMVSGITGRIVAKNIIADITGSGKVHEERMTEMYAACIASMGDSLFDGSAAVIMVNPIVPDFKKYPETGRDIFASTMEMGLAGAWMKRMLHTTFIYKLKGNPGWKIIPE